MFKILLLIEFFYVLPGIGLGYWLFAKSDLPTRAKVALTLFVSMLVVPFTAAWIALMLGQLIRLQILMNVAAVATLIFIIPLWRWFRSLRLALPKLDDLLLLCIAGGSAAFYVVFHTQDELMFQVYSWILRNDAYCFYLMIFKTMAAPGLPQAESLEQIHKIISTPGNVPWPATALVIFKKYGIHGVHAAFAATLACFSYLSVHHLLKKRAYALIAAAFAVLNPFVLNTPVLDRNFIALATSSVLFYLLITQSAGPLALGLLLGLVSGMGLRFLPILMVFGVGLSMYQRKLLKPWPIVLAVFGFAVTFSINLRHLALYPPLPGGQGEQISLFTRAPFLP
ncbi:MAG: hypothetical protein P9M14_13915, partial [Candidatus Alcyoniella australis]|nr:hypothetical protein [Candidatus Alcyoniella australis]